MTALPVFITDEQDLDVGVDDLLALARFVLADRGVPPGMELTLLLVDEATMAELNAAHLGGDGPTDVLAFPIDDPHESAAEAHAILGDVVLCPAVAHRQAAGLGRDGQQELRLLTAHGILHLLGMDHAEPAEEREMFALTDDLLAGYDAAVAP